MKKFIVFFTVCLCLVGCGKIGRGVSKVKVKAPKVKVPKGTKTDKSFGQIAAEEIGPGLLGEGIDAANNSLTDSNAQNTLGIKYFNKKDYKEAAKWYRKAAEQGNAYAQSNLGWLYLQGKGVLKNDQEAEKWFRKSADQGNKNGQCNLGHLLWERAKALGTNHTKDELPEVPGIILTKINVPHPQLIRAALRYTSMSALQGCPEAQLNMGAFYDSKFGKHNPWSHDNLLAYAWYSIAYLNGFKEAEARMNKLEKLMSQARIDKAQETAALVLKKHPKVRK